MRSYAFLKQIGSLALLAIPAMAAPFTLNTGAAAWTVTQTSGVSNNGAALNTVTPAVVLTGTLPTVWQTPGPGSAFVGQLATDGNYDPAGFNNPANCNSAAPTTTCGATVGTYVYSLSFDGSTGGVFSFRYSSDNGIMLSVTQGATTIYSSSVGQFELGNTGSIYYAPGANVVIRATVLNDALENLPRNPSSFLAYGSGDTGAIPEPSTYAMLGLGAVAMIVRSTRRA